MKRDYKFLADRRPIRRVPAVRHHHLVAVAVAMIVLGTLLGMAPDRASATRQDGLNDTGSPSLALPPDAVFGPSAEPRLGAPSLRPAEHPQASAPGDPPATRPAPDKQEGTWKTVTVESGDSLARIFSDLDLSPRELHDIMQLGKPVAQLRRLQPGEQLRFRISDDGHLRKLIHRQDVTRSLQVTHSDDGYNARQIEREMEVRIAHAAGTIDLSLFLSAREAGLSDRMTMELAAIFGWDVDFALDIRQGDQFVVVYEELYLDGQKVRDGNILAAEFTNRGNTFRAVRFTDPNGHTDYYSPDGHSMRKAFLRTPVKFTRISSRFNPRRRHPILNRIRAHKGVDYAAPRGTPVRATGDGKIVRRSRKGGYGRTVVIKHGSRYSTLYAHLSRYHRRARPGRRVKQGQIIAYVGASGLATGPHLHYEFRVNGVHRNPLTVKLPKAEPLPKRYRDDFQEVARPMLARLDLLRRTRLATNR